MHAGKGNKNAAKTLIVAEYIGVKVDLVENFEMGVSNKTPEFIKMNPIGKVGLPDSEIFCITDKFVLCFSQPSEETHACCPF